MKNTLMADVATLLMLVFCLVTVSAQDAEPRIINGGVLNGKALSLPKPEYSEEARAAKIEGTVRVNVLIDEQGTVISADPVINQIGATVRLGDGTTKTVELEPINPILFESAQRAAMAAKFSPTMLSGVSIKVRGILTYHFATTNRMLEINGGVLNGKAVTLPKPAYPPAAAAVRAGGAVSVQITIGEDGNVEYANAVSGHPLLRAAAVEAARGAKFSPTMLSGNPVKVVGIVVYNFVAPDEVDK